MIQILCADLHQTDDPNDEYRWGIFPFLRDKIRNLPLGQKILYILGDLTERKDRHSAKLVNRVVDNITSLYKQTHNLHMPGEEPQYGGLDEIVILRGNHDGLEGVAYFEFLKHLPYVKVITQPTMILRSEKRIALLPHTRNPDHEWKNLDLSSAHYVFAHVTLRGAKTESGFVILGARDKRNYPERLQDLTLAPITGERRVFSGDVHVPQTIGAVEYVGAPYPVRFGDAYQGRVLVLDTVRRTREEWHYPTIQKAKRIVRLSSGRKEGTNLFGLGLKKNDQLKVEVVLGKEDRHLWHKVREKVQRWCEAKGVLLRGVELRSSGTNSLNLKKSVKQALSPEKALKNYTSASGIGPTKRRAGKRLFRNAQNGPGTTESGPIVSPTHHKLRRS